MNYIYLELAAFIISAAAFLRGIAKMFRKGKPMYFQLLICSAGCFSLKELWTIINEICGVSGIINVGLIGNLGCFWFMLSANYGSLDSFVDDKSCSNKKPKILALIAPAVLALCLGLFIFNSLNNNSRANVLIPSACFIPTLAASYYSLKHLILPVDELGFLRSTKLCNIFIIMLCIAAYVELVVLLGGSSIALSAVSLTISCLMAGLVFACERGTKIWGTLI